MRSFLPLLTVLALIALLPGCSMLAPVADKVVTAVDIYCHEPLAERQLIRASVNAKLASVGHSIRVTCAGDASPASMTEFEPWPAPGALSAESGRLSARLWHEPGPGKAMTLPNLTVSRLAYAAPPGGD